MKKLNLSAVAMAVSALAAMPSFAGVNLDATSPAAQFFASELTPLSTSAVVLTAGALNDLASNATLGATFQNSTQAYIRFDVTGGTFNGTMPVNALSINTGAGYNFTGQDGLTVTVAQSSTSYVVFSVQRTTGLSQTMGVSLAPNTTFDGYRVTDKTGVSVQYRLYDNLGDAANAGTKVKDTGAKTIASFSTAGYSSTITSNTSTADVSATGGAYTAFVSAVPTNSSTTIQLGKIVSTMNANVANEAGVAFSSAAFNNTSTVVVTATSGSFAFTANANGGYDTLGRVFISANSDCTGNVATAVSLTSTTATFNALGSANFADTATRYVCATARSGATIGTATFSLSSTIAPSATRYGNISSPSATSFATIAQNGATIYVPLAQVATGYITRIALTNLASVDRPYTVTALGENNATVTLTGAAASGTLTSGKLNIIDLASLMSVTGGANRSTLKIIVNSPASTIRAAYQAVSPNGGISNNPLTVE